MDYTKANKAAWEQAFAPHQRARKTDAADQLLEPGFSFLDQYVLDELEQIQIRGKTVGQFCCNDGRELLSLVKLGAASAVGFDIAENFVDEARRLADKSGLAAQFVATDILDIPDTYADAFDLLFVSIGALCWFPDLSTFFAQATRVLRPAGTLLVHEQHPFTDMLATEDEPEFDPANPEKIAHSYFKNDPWVETQGIDYLGKTQYESSPSYSFAHTLSEILNALAGHGFRLDKFEEFNVDISMMFEPLSGKRLPLSYLLRAMRQ